ncbi:MAG: citryl-CoA lyase [Desulfatiglans sp.]|nr:citryl-CoA lyase [Thermodesulfobacteriota bacterium]MEE4354433.1 citryl-CoA lyase [Desulfatiglans sp.]
MGEQKSISVPGYESAITDVGFHKINVRGYPLTDIIRKLTFTEAVFLTIRGNLPSKTEKRVMDAVLCGIVDHGLFAPTGLATRVVASAAPDSIMPGIAAGMLTVGAVTVSPQDTANVIDEALKMVKEEGVSKEEAAKKIVEDHLTNRKRMPGLGHPLHPTGDPRAIALKEVAVENGLWGEKGDIYETIHKTFIEMTGKNFPINIDGMMGCVLSELGFAPKEMAGVAALSFMPGMIAHAVEESESIKLRVADCTYTGEPERKIP